MSDDETPLGNGQVTGEILREIRHVRRSHEQFCGEFRTEIAGLKSDVACVRMDMAKDQGSIDYAKAMAEDWPVVKDRVDLHHRALTWGVGIVATGVIVTLGAVIIWGIRNGAGS